MNYPEGYQTILQKASAKSFLGDLGNRLGGIHEDHSEDVVPLMEWMKRFRAYLARGKPFDLTYHQYLQGIYQDDHPEIVFCKAGQIGISEFLISWILWMIDQHKINGLYVFPKQNHVLDFSAARLGPAMEPETSPYLSRIMGSGKIDRVDLKRVGDRFLYFRGGTVSPEGRAPQLKSIDAGALVLDELDEMDPRAPAIARERLKSSPTQAIRIASTPTYTGTGIWGRYLETDQMIWFITCSHCGNKQDLKLSDLVLEFDDLDRPITWNKNQNGDPCLVCRKCGKELERGSPGEWVPTYPGRSIRGYHLSRLFAPFTDLNDIILGLKSVDDTTRKEITNQGLGLPYSSPTSYRITRDILDGCRREYGLTTQVHGKVSMGVDVGKLYHVVIRETTQTPGERKALFIGSVKETSDLIQLIKLYRVGICVIDALPETREIRTLQGHFPRGKIWLAYYPNVSEGTKQQSPFSFRGRDLVVDIDRTRSIDTCISEFVTASRGEPGKTLPANAASLPDYYDHVMAVEKRTKERNGKTVSFYGETGPDHFLHAENYETAAANCPLSESWGKGN